MWQEVAGFPAFDWAVMEEEVGVEGQHDHEAAKGSCTKQDHLRTIRNIIADKGAVHSLILNGITDKTVEIRISRGPTQKALGCRPRQDASRCKQMHHVHNDN